MNATVLEPRERFTALLRWCRRNPVTALGFGIILTLAILGLLAPLVAP